MPNRAQAWSSLTNLLCSPPRLWAPPSNGQGHKQWTPPRPFLPHSPPNLVGFSCRTCPETAPGAMATSTMPTWAAVITHPSRNSRGTEDPCACPSHPSACSQHSRWLSISVRHTTPLLTILDGSSVYTDVHTAKEMCWEKTCSGLSVRTDAQSWGCRKQHQKSVTE